MDYNEFEHTRTSLDPNKKYSNEIEFVVKQLNHIAHAGGRYDRSVQLPIAINIVRELEDMRRKQDKH